MFWHLGGRRVDGRVRANPQDDSDGFSEGALSAGAYEHSGDVVPQYDGGISDNPWLVEKVRNWSNLSKTRKRFSILY